MSDTVFLTFDEAKDRVGVDIVDDVVTRNINHAITVADYYLRGSIGEDYPRDDPRAKELGLMIVDEIYDKRGTIETVSGNVRKLWDDLSWQLRLELMEEADDE